MRFVVVLSILGCVPKGVVTDREYFPTATGRTWVYEGDLGETSITVEGTKGVEGEECFVFRMDGIRKDFITSQWRPFTQKSYYRITESAVLSVGTEVDNKQDIAVEPCPIIKFGTRAGDSWSCKVRYGNSLLENLGEEEVEVPAGRCKAIKIRSSGLLIPSGAKKGVELKNTEWYVRGIGLIMLKSEVIGYSASMKLKLTR